MKIGFVSKDYSMPRNPTDSLNVPTMGGSGWIRIGQHVKHLKSKGFNVEVGIIAFDQRQKVFGVYTYEGVTHFDCDIIVMQRYMHQHALRDMLLAQASGQIIINDVDDWYWGLSEKNSAYIVSHPTASPKENVSLYESIVKRSDGVITSTPFLTDNILKWNENTKMVSNYVDVSMFDPPYKHLDKKRITVGWLGSTMHRSGDLEILRDVAIDILEFAGLHHSGHFTGNGIRLFHDEIGVPAREVSTHPMVLPYRLREAMCFDVGVVPLVDIPFNHAKSYIKGLEYAASGIPFVASWSPQYQELSEEHGIGVVVRSPQDYVGELRKFTDFEYRVKVASDNLAAVQKFDTSIGSEVLYKTIMELADAAR